MAVLWKIITVPIKWFLIVLVLYVLWALVAYRDIPVATLEQQYGGEQLQQLLIDGVPLRYKVEGTGPAVVLLHSHYFDMGMWDAWVDHLKPHYTLIRYDMPTHGLTGPDPTGDYSMARNLYLLNALVDHLQLQEFAVVGSSLGGNIAFHYSASNPERITALTLVNSGGLKRKASSGRTGTIPKWVDYVSYLLPTAAFDAFLQWMIVDDNIVTTEQAERFHRMFRREGNRFSEFDRMRQFETGEPDEVLAKVVAPVLIQWGRENPQLPFEFAQTMADKMTSASSIEVIIYPEAGHVLPLELPQQSAADFDRFFKNVLANQEEIKGTEL